MPAPRQKRTIGSVINRLIQRVNADTRRLRMLEQENIILKTRVTATEKESLAQRNQLQKSIKELEKNMGKLEDSNIALQNTIKEIIKEIKKLATIGKVKELQTLIEIYNPIKSQFVTKEEVERIIEDNTEES